MERAVILSDVEPNAAGTASSVYLAGRRSVGSGTTIHVGIDENGLGPVLGPMIVTGVAFASEGRRPASLGELVGDSKALLSFGHGALGEAWARALVTAIAGPIDSPAALIAKLSLDDTATLQAPCPTSDSHLPDEHRVRAMCWPNEPERFVAEPSLVDQCAQLIQRWTGDGHGALRLVGVAIVVVCPQQLNAALSAGRHKFLVDLHSMERIALALSAQGPAGALLDAVCGKVGGFDRYSDHWGPLSGRLSAIEDEGRVVSTYRFPGLGRIAFLRDADAADPLVGLASLVGKYIRDLTMRRVLRWMSSADAFGPASELPHASGYHDRVTKRFIEASALIRARRSVPDRCFLRER